MKGFHCACGHRVFFDSATCLGCGGSLGFNPDDLTMSLLNPVGASAFDPSLSGLVKPCRNEADHGNCNWVLPTDEPYELCISCRANLVVPNLGRADNLLLWTRIERAKRRLLYTLLKLRLVSTEHEDSLPSFRFLEDRGRNPNVAEDFVPTGYEQGVITLNILEADDTSRQAQRQRFHERYRTVLGHLRHEAGHYFFERLTERPGDLDACRELFGDERPGYAEALRGHYEVGPRRDWPDRYVSAYASIHPSEDFAECFAHYLLIIDALETAQVQGLGSIGTDSPWIELWIETAVALNELSRSLGGDDAYPFVLTPAVIEKLELVDSLVRRCPDAQTCGEAR